MAYSKFTLVTAKKQLELKDKRVTLFKDIKPINPSAWLKETLEITDEVAYFSEKSRSEGIVMPILLEIKRQSNNFAIYSGALLDVDKKQGLNGEVDFILGRSTQNYELEAPLFCMVEAKDNDIEIGLGQCVAQMYAARLFDEREGYDIKHIYGCVTSGVEWQFLKLEGDTILIEKQRYYLQNLPQILGFLKKIVEE